MSTPNPEDDQRQRVRPDSDAESPRSHIGSILWILVLVALIAIGIWWYSQETEVLVPQPPTAVEDPLPAVNRPVAPVVPGEVEAPTPVADEGAAPVGKADRPKSAPKPTATVPRDRSPVPLPTNRKPEYPSRALRSGVEGSVSVLIEINARGVPTDVRVVSRRGERSRDLDRAVLNAARDWRFEPARRNGRAVPGEVILPVDFGRN